jgi:UTP--glucose-1-phosphate uridylyltransferase
MKKLIVKKAVIPAAGLGTRFLPITKVQPKEMLPIVDKPVIQYVVEEAVASGIDDILIITGRNKRAIEDHFDRSIALESVVMHKKENSYFKSLATLDELPNIHYIRQKELRGLGDAVLQAERHCYDEPFAILLGDTICISPKGETPCTHQIIRAFTRYQKPIIAVEHVPKDKIQDYGIIDAQEIEHGLYKIQDIIEKPSPITAPSDLGAIGRYILTPEIFTHLHDLKPGYGDEIQLTDALHRLHEPLGLITNCRRYDIGDKIGWMKSNIELTLDREEFATDMRKFLLELLSR